jgi:NAD(P)-dependent dehydrogenase (short-subunit alcohol dehydrogenase family)
VPARSAGHEGADQGRDRVLGTHRFGRVGTWVNCAAVSVWGRVEDVTDEEFDRILHVDPAKLIIGANVRVDPRLDDEFLASIKTDGVEEVVTVHRG